MSKILRSHPSLFVLSSLFTFLLSFLASIPAAAQAGSLDPTFGTNGIFTIGPTSAANTVALQSNGEILVAGQVSNLGSVLRLNTNGTLDTTFGTAGVAKLNFSVVEGVVTGMAIESDGKIIVVGNGLPQGGDIFRLNTNGSIDTTFGTNGSVTLENNPELLALLPSGEFLVTSVVPGTTNSTIQRYQNNGQLDTIFGTSGTAAIVGDTAIGLLSNGNFVLTALGLTLGNGSVSEYDANGTLETTFGISGQVATLNGAAIAVQTNGRIVTAGAVASQLSASGNSQGFGVTRFLSNGTVDTTFGTRGGVMTTFADSPTTAATSVVIQSDGDIVVGGEAGTGGNFGKLVESFALARYLSTGALDTSFGTNGLVTTSFPSPSQAVINALALQADGKILAVGNNGNLGEGTSSLVVARYLGQ